MATKIPWMTTFKGSICRKEALVSHQNFSLWSSLVCRSRMLRSNALRGQSFFTYHCPYESYEIQDCSPHIQLSQLAYGNMTYNLHKCIVFFSDSGTIPAAQFLTVQTSMTLYDKSSCYAFRFQGRSRMGRARSRRRKGAQRSWKGVLERASAWVRMSTW